MLQPSCKFSNTKLLVIILPTKNKKIKKKDLHGFHGFLPNRILIYLRKIEIQIIRENYSQAKLLFRQKYV